jgi:NAD+ synthetase
MKFAIAQQNFIVGDIEGNFNKIANLYKQYQDKIDVIIFPELSLTSYPPEDLLLSQKFLDKCKKFHKKIVKLTQNSQTAILYGDILQENNKLYNGAFYIKNNNIIKFIKKVSLPNYGVFDELRYFTAGKDFSIIKVANKNCLILICEDLWQDDLIKKLQEKKDHIDKIIILNASPFSSGKFSLRYNLTNKIVHKLQIEVIYVNLVGAQDMLVFDGRSFVMNQKGELTYLLKPFIEEVKIIDDNNHNNQVITPVIDELEDIYNALILSLRNYVAKNNFKSVLIGLSGGVDSAFCAVLAADALGIENVNLVKMPSKYTSQESFIDADNLINSLECKNIFNFNIENIFNSFTTSLDTSFKNLPSDATEENLQARIRGTLLMALSNKFSHLVLATSNKSETAVGYSTLYGDMCGAFSPIKDIYKTQLYQLSSWRNKTIPLISFCKKINLISKNIINKDPTAELRENQKDSDNLPPYNILDQIVYYIIEEHKSISEIEKLGFKLSDITKVNKLLLQSEYKRKQAALGTKISKLSFDKERRMPITNKYSND